MRKADVASVSAIDVFLRYPAAFAIILCFVATLSWLASLTGMSADALNVMEWYYSVPRLGCHAYEPLFCGIALASASAGLSGDYFLVALFILTYGALAFSILLTPLSDRLSSHWLIVLLVVTSTIATSTFAYFSPSFVSHLSRQYLAGGLVVLSLALLLRGNTLFASISLVAATSVHITAILSILAVPLYILRLRAVIYALFAGLFLISVIYCDWHRNMLEIINQVGHKLNYDFLKACIIDGIFIKIQAYLVIRMCLSVVSC